MLLENLENRRLLSFGDDNVVTRPSVMDPPFVRPVEVAVGAGDKIVASGGNLIARFNADGSSDTAFGSNGVATAALDEILDVAVQGDGKIVVAGRFNGEFAVARYTGTGQLDTTFSGDGLTNRSFGGTPGADVAHAVAVQPDGKIVAVGAGRTGRSGSATTLVITRYNANGSIDTTFDNDGYSAELLRTGNDAATDVEIAPGGKIVVGGTTGTTGVVIRYNTGGSFDTGFSGDGIAYLDEEHGDAPGSVSAVAVQPDGKVVWAGGTVIPYQDRFVPYAIVGRLNANGTEDDAFSLGGSTYLQGVFRDDQTTASFAHDLTLDAHGNIIVVGQEERDDGAVSLSAITVLKPDGAVHPAYDDENDFAYLGFDSRSAAEGVAIQSDGDVIVAGEHEGTTMMLARVDGVDDDGGTPGGGDGTGLSGTYYSNVDFSGNSITRTDAAVNFNWGTGGPSSKIGTDTFSARWTGQIEAEKTERYTFHTRTDDGARLWVNGQLLIDKWVPQSATGWSGSIDLVAGQKYDIKVEYFERFGQAVAELRWSSATTPKEIVPTSQLFPSRPGPADTQAPTAPSNLRATPTHSQVVLDWNPAADNVGVSAYEIFRGEERIARLLGDELSHVDGDVEPNTTYVYRVIAVDAAGNRSDPAAVMTVTQPVPATGGLQAIFYDNMDFTDEELRRTDVVVDFDWGRGTPDLSIQPDTFSVRFFGLIEAQKTERYTFYTRSDDGARLKVNGVTLIDKLVPQSETEWSGSIDLEGGRPYVIELDYFERFGEAKVQLFWSSPSTPKQIVPATSLLPM